LGAPKLWGGGQMKGVKAVRVGSSKNLQKTKVVVQEKERNGGGDGIIGRGRENSPGVKMNIKKKDRTKAGTEMKHAKRGRCCGVYTKERGNMFKWSLDKKGKRWGAKLIDDRKGGPLGPHKRE